MPGNKNPASFTGVCTLCPSTKGGVAKTRVRVTQRVRVRVGVRVRVRVEGGG